MKAHNWHALGWLVWAIVSLSFFAVWEHIGMVNREDDRHPLTYYIRKMVDTPNNPLWWILGAILVWMLYHFLFVKH